MINRKILIKRVLKKSELEELKFKEWIKEVRRRRYKKC